MCWKLHELHKIMICLYLLKKSQFKEKEVHGHIFKFSVYAIKRLVSATIHINQEPCNHVAHPVSKPFRAQQIRRC